MRHARTWVLVGWFIALLFCARVIVQTTFVADLSAFMPKMPTARQQLLVDQLRDGFITRLVMVGIEGGDATQRAQLSQQLAQALRKAPDFLAVQNGDAATRDRDQAYMFGNRYLLSPAVTPERFTAGGLRQAIGESLSALSGNAGMALKQLLPRDPTAETLAILEQFAGESQPATQAGAWASRDGQRAILLLQTRADGADLDAQSAAIEHVRQAFDAIPGRTAATRLVMSGAGVFSVASRARVEHEVMRLGLAGMVLVIALLLPVYRSVGLLLLGLLPVLTGALVGITAVSLGFGQVHGLTLGFGTTLIGEAVDYSIYTFIQHGGGHGSSGFWRTIRLGVMTSVAGFGALLFSGFPGLSQLGLYSISGLVAAALVTRYVLPLLMPAQLRLRDLSGVGRWNRGSSAWAAMRGCCCCCWPAPSPWSRGTTTRSGIASCPRSAPSPARSRSWTPRCEATSARWTCATSPASRRPTSSRRCVAPKRPARSCAASSRVASWAASIRRRPPSPAWTRNAAGRRPCRASRTCAPPSTRRWPACRSVPRNWRGSSPTRRRRDSGRP
jgi:predicted exporter